MKLSEVRNILDAKVLTGEEYLEKEVHTACGSDLMSDVLAFVKVEGVLLTGLVNPQVVRTAEMMDIHAIVFVRGKQPEKNILDLANSLDMLIMTTEEPMYIACGKLYGAGLVGKGVRKIDE